MNYKEVFLTKLLQEKGDKYSLIGEYKGSKNLTTFKHNVCGYVWEARPSGVLRLKGCPECQRLGNSTLPEDFPEIFYRKVNKKEFILDDTLPYSGQSNPIRIKHTKCGNTFITYWGTFTSNSSCPHCRDYGGRRKSHDNYYKQVREMYGDEYELLSRYETALSPVKVRHNKCGNEFNIRAAHFISGHGCSRCNSSTGELLTRRSLNRLNIKFEEQYKFDDCIDKKPLPFDFAVLSDSGNVVGLIEYDGSQHYQAFSHFGGEDKYRKQILHDSIKNSYANNNGYPILRIPYTLSSSELDKEVRKFIAKLSN